MWVSKEIWFDILFQMGQMSNQIKRIEKALCLNESKDVDIYPEDTKTLLLVSSGLLKRVEKALDEMLTLEISHQAEELREEVRRFMKHQTVITSNGTNRTEVVVDGIDLSDVITEIRFVHTGGKLPVLEMVVANCDIKIKSPLIPQLPEALQNFYKISD